MSANPEARQAMARLREGTEILRTGGGRHLTAAECNAILDRLEEAERERQRWEDQANGQLDRAQRAERKLETAEGVLKDYVRRAEVAESALAERERDNHWKDQAEGERLWKETYKARAEAAESALAEAEKERDYWHDQHQELARRDFLAARPGEQQ